MDETVTLYRPTGPHELALVKQADFKRWPARLDWQPIFYPVLNREYAIQIARDWNAKDAQTGYRGYVTRFRVRASFMQSYTVHRVGARVHEEYWIPADDLDALNDNIVGHRRVLRRTAHRLPVRAARLSNHTAVVVDPASRMSNRLAAHVDGQPVVV